MSTLHAPWLLLSVATPLVGSLWVGRLRDAAAARKGAVAFAAIACATTLAAWGDGAWIGTDAARDAWNLFTLDPEGNVFVLDRLSAPLLPLVALAHLLTFAITPRTKIRRFTFAWNLASEGVHLAVFSVRLPWLLVVLVAAGSLFPWLELRLRGRSTNVFTRHMAGALSLLVLGCMLNHASLRAPGVAVWGNMCLVLAILVRAGIAPAHCWVTDLFEKATFGTALLFVAPMTGTYLAARLLVPQSPPWMLALLEWLSLASAAYTVGMALVQREARRFFCYLFLSLLSLVMAGLASVTPIGLAGGLSLWLSTGLAMTGFGLTVRAIEARTGRLSLVDFHGLYDHVGTLPLFFLLTGLAAVGFPGTFGFVGAEMVVDGAFRAYPFAGMAVVLAAAMAGIAVIQAYFLIFTGTRHVSSVSLRQRRRESFAVLAVTALIFAGGIWPQPGVVSRLRAATSLLAERSDGLSERTVADGSRGSARR